MFFNIVHHDNQIILLTTQRLSVNQNIVIGNSGERLARALNLSQNGHARGVTRIKKKVVMPTKKMINSKFRNAS